MDLHHLLFLQTFFSKKVPISDILCTITLGFPSSVLASAALKTIMSPILRLLNEVSNELFLIITISPMFIVGIILPLTTT